MEVLRFDTEKRYGSFKPLNAVNNGPCHKRHTNSQHRSNLAAYRDARIPYARCHDTSEYVGYGAEHVVDITAIFPNFSADPCDPASYDFPVTDEYIQVTLEAGTETFYRLGQKIEHWVKKYGTLPPPDFHKWAVICEHIIRHYNEGWANGYHLGIRYWEIWNEPDLDTDDSTHKRTWGGTKALFFDFFEVAAKHLKACFPHLKIGGPALAKDMTWAADFLTEMHRREVPLDFFSWHIYCVEPAQMLERAQIARQLMDANGYEYAESIINEWNYVKSWGADFTQSVETIIGMKGAAFTMACMAAAQKAPIDMLMYYDAKPHFFNGLFDFYTLGTLKGYYPFLWYGMLNDYNSELRCEAEPDGIYTLCGAGADGRLLCIIANYSDENPCARKIRVDFGRPGCFELLRLDEMHDGTADGITDGASILLPPNACVLLRETAH